MTALRRRSLRLAALGLLAGLSVFALSACSSSGGGSNGGGPVRETVRLVIDSGTGIRGVDVSMTHDTQLVVLGVDPVGIFLNETCEQNVGTNFVNLVCLKTGNETFDAPAPGWSFMVEHPADTVASDYVFTLSCEASDAFGNGFPVGCSLQ